MAHAKRPVSPHLQVYRWSVTMASSILHRATGVALGAGTLLLAWWLLAAATSDEALALVQLCMGSVLGQLVMLGFVWALTYHLFNGIRHLVWDMGYGFEMKTAQISGWLALIGSAVVTAGIAFLSTGGAS
jgi:succinate dehydrogenase / fumarate reductase cytochrome b subunit